MLSDRLFMPTCFAVARFALLRILVIVSLSTTANSRASAFVILPITTSTTNESPIQLFGVLSRSAILGAARRQRNQQNKKQGSSSKRSGTFSQEPLTEWFLAGAIQEAQHRQQHILDALERESQQSSPSVLATTDTPPATQEKMRRKAERRKHATRQRGMEVQACLSKLKELGNKLHVSNLETTNQALIDLGFQKLLADPDLWKWNDALNNDVRKGSPPDFGGLVYTTPFGVPILVGAKGAHGDSTLRRISQGADIWFQVSDYHGSRVLLRTSLVRGLKDSKECRIMAANLAAYYSDYRNSIDAVPVMYTDSKHVAKRGSKAGQMRKKKAFGVMRGRPFDVAAMAEGQEP